MKRRDEAQQAIRWGRLRKLTRWLMSRAHSWRPRPPRQLRVLENLALGERRFLSVVEYGHQRYLVGGTGNSLAMLATIPSAEGCQPGAQPAEPPTWTLRGGGLVREVNSI